MSSLVLFATVTAVVGLGYMVYLIFKVLGADEGDDRIKELVASIREGAEAFLKRQYVVVSMFLGIVFVVLLVLKMVGLLESWLAPFAFLTAGAMSGLAGYLGMRIATASNGRTTFAATKGLNEALRVAFDGGSVLGMSVVGFGLLYICVWFLIMHSIGMDLRIIAEVLVTSAMGASTVALFARVGGGIFTKAADVGADLAGKVEAGIPEDDPRNPAVIADNVGDNVGDVAGMGADLFESYVGSIVAAMALGVSAFVAAGLSPELQLSGAVFPMLLAGIGIISSIVGGFFIQAKEGATQEDLLKALRRGVLVSAGLVFIFSLGAVFMVFGAEYWGIWAAMVVGLVAGIVIGTSSEFYTSTGYKPTQEVSESSLTGSATLIISGTALGMRSTAIPVIAVGLGILLSYAFGSTVGGEVFGLYGIGIAAVGMLSTLGVTLASDAYGPIADNAGGLAEMSEQDPKVRERTDALDSLGNTNAATGKGFAIGSAALTALALITNYNDKIDLLLKDAGGSMTALFTGREITSMFELSDPFILVGLFIGGMLPFMFSAMTMSSVGRAAGQIVDEVRRQFKEIPGLLEGTGKPDYTRCVDISTRTAHKEMVMPAVLAVASPLVVGILFGVGALLGLLVGALVCGFLLAILMANAGGSWDNAKKYIEEGHHGGKGSEQHKAAVVGDTVGDPYKDTSGPSINILVKLMSVVSLVFVALIMKLTLF
jgi:K(+)-stimulated pyrophosphate-energized sodium pump